LSEKEAFFVPFPPGSKARPTQERRRAWVKIKTAQGRHIDEERAKWKER